jgi:hypothetical protein
MKAKKKPIEKVTADDLGVDLAPVLETIKVTEPPKRVGGGKVGNSLYYGALLRRRLIAPACYVQVGSVDELVARLREAGMTRSVV